MNVPYDLSIAGFEDSPFSRQSWPPLTTAKQATEDIARHAARLLIAQLRSDAYDDAPAPLHNQGFVPQLVVRGSTAPMRPAGARPFLPILPEPAMSLSDPTSTLMFAEAAEAADVVAASSRATTPPWKRWLPACAPPPPFVVTCARGSSDHAATYGKYLLETQLGLVVASASPSVGSVTPRRCCAVRCSSSFRSRARAGPAAQRRGGQGRWRARDRAGQRRGFTAGAAGRHGHPLHAGAEKSVAATKSYLASLAALLQLAAYWKQDSSLRAALDLLPDALREAWQCDWSAVTEGLVDATNLFVLGRGLGLGAAQEAALKFKETCSLHAEAYSSAEVKHGPMALVDRGFPVLAFAQPDETGAGTRAVVDEFTARGAQVWLAGAGGNLPVAAAPHPLCAPLLTVQSFYRAINALALRRGFNPDLPPHLNKVTETV